MEKYSLHSKLETFYQISNFLVSNHDLDNVLKTITEETVKLANYDLVSIYLLEGEQLKLKSIHKKPSIPSNCDVLEKNIHLHQSLIGDSINRNESILIDNVEDYPQYAKECKLGMQSKYCIPLNMNDQIIGTFVIASKSQNAFKQDDLQFLNALAKSSTIAIHHTINYNIIHALGRISNITSKKNYDIITSYTELIHELLKVFYFDGLEIIFPHPFRKAQLSFPIYRNNEVLPLQKKIIALNRVKNYFNLKEPAIVESNSKQTILLLPAIVQDKTIALIKIKNRRINAYNKWEIDTISQLILQAAPAIENLSHTVLKSEVSKVKKIARKLTNTLNHTNKLEETLIRYIDIAKRYLRYTQTKLWILDQEKLKLRLLDRYQTTELALTDKSPIVRSFMEKKTLFNRQSELIIPLCDDTENQCVGVLTIMDRNHPAFNEDAIIISNQYIRPIGIPILKHLKNAQLEKANLMMIQALTVALDKKDAETQGHSQRVITYSISIAKRMGISEAIMKRIHWGALLHDIGKIGIPDAILLKPGKLTEDEWIIMKTHPMIGYEMISHIEFLEGAVDIILYHHEHWDGSGYPHGLKEEEIPLPARIFAVADAFDAITSQRPYKESKSIPLARKIIQESMGTHFCPEATRAFLSIPVNELYSLQRENDTTILTS